MYGLRRPSRGISHSAKYEGEPAARPAPAGSEAARAEHLGLASPPSNALFMTGLSCYPNEQYSLTHRSQKGRATMFDVTKEAHDRHGNPVRYERDGPNQQTRMAEAREAWVAAEKARADVEDAEPRMETEYQAATKHVEAPPKQFTPTYVELDRQVRRITLLPPHGFMRGLLFLVPLSLTQPPPPPPSCFLLDGDFPCLLSTRSCGFVHGSAKTCTTLALNRIASAV